MLDNKRKLTCCLVPFPVARGGAGRKVGFQPEEDARTFLPAVPDL